MLDRKWRRAFAGVGCATLLAVTSLMSAGCAFPKPQQQSTLPPASKLPDEITALSLYILQPAAATCSSTADLLRERLIQVARQQGFRVVENVNLPHDADLVVAIKENGSPCHMRSAMEIEGEHYLDASLSYELRAGRRTIVEGATSPVRETDAQPNVAERPFAERAARMVLVPLGASPEILAYARSRQGPAATPKSAQAGTPIPSSGDERPLVGGAPQPTAYAIVVGVERYPSLPVPSGARRDAESFSRLARSTLGLPETHVRTLIDGDATKGAIEAQIEWARTSVPSNGRIFFFYSGHGTPDLSTGAPYILPVDGDPSYLAQTALLLSKILEELSNSKAREVITLIDACFSGAGGRSVLPVGTRPLLRTREVEPRGHVAVFSATSSTQISGPTSSNQNGVFSHYVFEGLGSGSADSNGDGQISIKELAAWVTPRVEQDAKRANRDQTPTLRMGGQAGDPSEVILAWGLPTSR